ncbi:MAG: tetraacyldisaccharide 4'-kinase [Flavobacteriales bacterium]|nr:tetraacyldisaccharide 4'-kinase [Flavobacteriales bacterium]
MNLFKIILSPLALIYYIITSFRNAAFKWGLLKRYKSSIPVVSIGNLSMGGTGKTPHVAFVLENLNGLNKAVISRGYGRKSKKLIEGNTQLHTSNDLGDEPMELLKRFEGKDFKMIVEGDRTKALKYLEQHKEKTDVVILDDGFQHQYVQRDLNILLTEYSKPFYTDFTVPAGTLREPRKEADRADIIIVTKCPKHLPVEVQNDFKNKIANYGCAKIFFSQIEYKGFLNSTDEKIELKTNKPYLLITGIANPNPIHNYLKEIGLPFEAMTFKDHHNFNKKEIQLIAEKSKSFEGVITTEKDWMRLRESELRSLTETNLFRLEMGIKIMGSEKQEEFLHQLGAKY